MKKVFILLLIGLISSISEAQRKKLDLDDIKIQGELFGDDRLNILNRQENELRNFVRFRTNYRNEIVEELPEPRPGIAEKIR
jgi:hypothetical protein